MNNDIELLTNLSKIDNKIVVLSGKGGVGKSTVAVNLAVGLALNGKKVGLLDTDIHGPSIPKMLNIEDKKPKYIDDKIIPVSFSENLSVISSAMFLEKTNQPLIWRGPRKMAMINQFLKDTNWGELDYLIIDSPPGTGDEPLSVVQLLGKIDGAIIVTTPQKISQLDVSKSISFCHELNVQITGIVENMSGFVCPDCGGVHHIFKSDNSNELAQQAKTEIIAKIPIEPCVAESGDNGEPFIYFNNLKTETSKEFEKIVDKVLGINNSKKKEEKTMVEKLIEKVAIPTVEGKLCLHFGHCDKFYIGEVDSKTGEILSSKLETPPVHEPGVLPRWLGEKKVNLIIGGGMGSRAQQLFSENNIKVVVGAPVELPEEIIKSYYNNTLKVGSNTCDH